MTAKSNNTDELIHPAQIAALRRMTPQQKVYTMAQMLTAARQSKSVWLRKQHPGWTDAQIAEALRQHMLHGAS